MKHVIRSITGAFVLASVMIAPGSGFAAAPVAPLAAPSMTVPVQANCNAVAQQLGAQYGGRAKGTLQDRGGKRVCVVVIVVDGKDGQRGERIQKEVPLE
ncbi:MAG: hypothetical protein WBF87_16105 [Mesorhizobium sp.]